MCQFSGPNCGTVVFGCGKIGFLPIEFEQHGVVSWNQHGIRVLNAAHQLTQITLGLGGGTYVTVTSQNLEK